RVRFGLLHFDDVQEHLVLGELLNLGLELLDAGALLADHDARAGGVNIDLDLVGRALDLDAGDPGAVELLLEEPAKLNVLMKKPAVVALGVPTAVPSAGNAQAETNRIDFLTHSLILLPLGQRHA